MFSKVEQGPEYTDWWAVTAYEQLKSELALLRTGPNPIGMTKLSRRLKNHVIPTWDHIARVLALEPPDSHPFQVGQAVQRDVKAARDMVRMIDYL